MVVGLMLLVLKLMLPSLKGLMGGTASSMARSQLIGDLNRARNNALRNGDAVYVAFNRATAAVKSRGSEAVPTHLRNAPTALARAEGHGEDYRYDPDEPGGFAAGQTYFPAALGELIFYEPVDRGMEIKIAEKLERLRNEGKAGGGDTPAVGRVRKG